MTKKSHAIGRMGRIGIKSFPTRAQMISAAEQASQSARQIMFTQDEAFFWIKIDDVNTNRINDYSRLGDFSSTVRTITHFNVFTVPDEASIPGSHPSSVDGDFLRQTDTDRMWVKTNGVWVPATLSGNHLNFWNPDSDAVYDSDDLVVYNSAIYKNISGEQTQNPPDSDDGWIEITDNKDPVNYVTGRTYLKGDRVYFNTRVYECIVDSTTNNPQIAPSDWTVITDFWDVWPTWRSSVDYIENDVVNHQGLIYVALSSGQDDTPPPDNRQKWLGLNTLFQYDYDEFVPGQPYPIGSILKDSDGTGTEIFYLVDSDFDGGQSPSETDFEHLSEPFIAVPKWRDEEYVLNDIINYRGVLYRNITGRTNYPETPDLDKVNWFIVDNLETDIFDPNKRFDYNDGDRYIKSENYFAYTPLGTIANLDLSDSERVIDQLYPGDFFVDSERMYHFTYETAQPDWHVDLSATNKETFRGLYSEYYSEIDAEDVYEIHGRTDIVEKRFVDLGTKRGVYRRNSIHEPTADYLGDSPFINSTGIDSTIPKWFADYHYVKGDIVAHNGAIYVCKTASGTSPTGWEERPDINDNDWYAIYEKDQTFDPSRVYFEDSIIVYKGLKYRKLTPSQIPEIPPDDSDLGRIVWAEEPLSPYTRSFQSYNDLKQTMDPIVNSLPLSDYDSESIRFTVVGRTLMFVVDTNTRWALDFPRSVLNNAPFYKTIDEEFIAAETSLNLLTQNFPPALYGGGIGRAEAEKGKVINNNGITKHYISDGAVWDEDVPDNQYIRRVYTSTSSSKSDNSWSNDATIWAEPVGTTINIMSEMETMVHVQNWNPICPSGHEYLLTLDSDQYSWTRNINILSGDCWWPILTDADHGIDLYSADYRSQFVWDMNYCPHNYTAYGVRPEITGTSFEISGWDEFPITSVPSRNATASIPKIFNVRVAQTPDSEVYMSFWNMKGLRWKLTASSTNTKNETPSIDYHCIEWDSDQMTKKRIHDPLDYYNRQYADGFPRWTELDSPIQSSNYFATAYYKNGPLVAGCLKYDHSRWSCYDTDAERNWIPSKTKDINNNFIDPDPSITIQMAETNTGDITNEKFWFFGTRVQPIQRERTPYFEGYVTKGGHPNKMTYRCFRDGSLVKEYECTLIDENTRVDDPTNNSPDNFYGNIQYIDLWNNHFHKFNSSKLINTVDFGDYYYDMYHEYRPGIWVDKVEVVFHDWQTDSVMSADLHRENFGLCYFCPILSGPGAEFTGTGTLRNEVWLRVGQSNVVANNHYETRDVSWSRLATGTEAGNLVGTSTGSRLEYHRSRNGSLAAETKAVVYYSDGYEAAGFQYDDIVYARDLWIPKTEIIQTDLLNKSDVFDINHRDFFEMIDSDMPRFWEIRND